MPWSGSRFGGGLALQGGLVLYGAAWLVSLIGLLAFRAARLELGMPVVFIVLITLGTLTSAWLSQRPLSENTRLIFGFLDATLALFAITAQPTFNALVNMPTDPSIEIYLSTSLLWYFTLRTPLMVSPASVLFQGVPVMAMFGLIGSYLFAPAVPYLFLAFVMVLIVMLIAARQVEWEVRLPLAIIGRYVLVVGIAASMAASVVAFLFWLILGELISGLVIGLPFRPSAARSNVPALPALQVGAGPVVPSDMEVLRVRFLRGDARYLRMDAYDLYTGRGWNRTRMGFMLVEPNARGEFVMPQPPEYMHQREVYAEITTMGGVHQQFYTPGLPVWLKPSEPRRAVGFALHTGTLWVRRPLSPGSRYEIRALVPPEDPAILRGRDAITPFWSAWSESARNARVFELVRRLTSDQPTDYDKVLALKHYIETHTAYNIETEAYPPDEDAVEYFLFVAREGYCTEFATALAVMCQYAGLSARVASGFLLTERDPQTGEYIVREKHRHTWTEVYFSGLGWVPFDATQNAPVINAGTLIGGNSGSDPSHLHPLLHWRRLLDGLIIAGVLYLLWSLVLAKRFTTPQGMLSRGGRLYARLVFMLRLLGCPAPAPYQSPADYLKRCAAILRARERTPSAASLVEALQEPILRLLYAPAPEANAAKESVQGKINALRQWMGREVGYPRLIGRAMILKWRDWSAWSDASDEIFSLGYSAQRGQRKISGLSVSQRHGS
ncbi:Protein-glutamine gamma-glutamyltransferase [bacterium HR15]|nr:Protein-glutamine gamma-glutamyltransferase [bacterium HR15]